MKMDKDLWLKKITEKSCPPWPCPTCGAGVLVLDKPSFRREDTQASMRDKDEDWWDHEHVVISFNAWAECSNQACKERVALGGSGGVFVYPDENWNTVYGEDFQLRYAHPPLQIIQTPAGTPRELDLAISSSFQLFWLDRAAAASRIRTAVERLLDHLGIPAKTERGGFLSLDTRVDLFSKTDPITAQHLMALKWLGNVGSHTAHVNAADILDAYVVLEYVLAEVIEKRSESIRKTAEAIAAKYGKRPNG